MSADTEGAVRAATVEGGRSQRLQPASRAGVMVLLALAAANGAFLFLTPASAEADYAWAIAPPINAAFLGAGYLAGTLATALVVFAASSWRSLRVLPAPLVVLSLVLLAATLVHADRFRWEYPPTWLWTAVYTAVPVGVALLWRRQERAAPPPPARERALTPLRGLSAVLGTVLALVAVALLVAPVATADIWPWPLTPLLARALAAWYALVATALIASAVTLRRSHEVVIPFATLLAWSGLLLLLPAIHPVDLTGPDAALGAWLALHALLVALAVYALARAIAIARERGERL